MLYIYLNEAAIIAAGGTVATERCGPKDNQYDREVIKLQRRSFNYSDGRPYICEGGTLANYEIPQELQGFVVEVSWYDNFGYDFLPRRQLGFYRYKSATAELSEIGGKNCHYHVKVLAETLEDAKELNFLIREGKIWPAIDYEQVQVPPPARHLRQLGREAWALIRREVSDRLYRIQLRIRTRIGL
jgi:hypothetical protein